MAITTVLFDLDGTLLPMDQDAFIKGYFNLLVAQLAPHGYEPKKMAQTMWTGIQAMLANDGTRTNEQAFWQAFTSIYGEKALEDMPLFDEFYATAFEQARVFCGKNPQAAQAVRTARARGLRVALATNPLFPAVATQCRIRWAGLEPKEFELVTTYEQSRFCKPRLAYYREVASCLGVSPQECLMVGNDVGEDMVARQLGMQVFLLTDCLIQKEGVSAADFPQGGFDALLHTLMALGESGDGCNA